MSHFALFSVYTLHDTLATSDSKYSLFFFFSWVVCAKTYIYVLLAIAIFLCL